MERTNIFLAHHVSNMTTTTQTVTCDKCGELATEYSTIVHGTICKQCLQEELDMLEQDDEA